MYNPYNFAKIQAETAQIKTSSPRTLATLASKSAFNYIIGRQAAGLRTPVLPHIKEVICANIAAVNQASWLGYGFESNEKNMQLTTVISVDKPGSTLIYSRFQTTFVMYRIVPRLDRSDIIISKVTYIGNERMAHHEFASRICHTIADLIATLSTMRLITYGTATHTPRGLLWAHIARYPSKYIFSHTIAGTECGTGITMNTDSGYYTQYDYGFDSELRGCQTTVAKLGNKYVSVSSTYPTISYNRHRRWNTQTDKLISDDVRRDGYLPSFRICVEQGQAQNIIQHYNNGGADCKSVLKMILSELTDEQLIGIPREYWPLIGLEN